MLADLPLYLSSLELCLSAFSSASEVRGINRVVKKLHFLEQSRSAALPHNLRQNSKFHDATELVYSQRFQHKCNYSLSFFSTSLLLELVITPQR